MRAAPQTINPLSVTALEYGTQSCLFNRVTADVVESYYNAVMHAFDALHELQRPPGAPSLRLITDAGAPAEAELSSAAQDKKDRRHAWQDFHFDRFPTYGGRTQYVAVFSIHVMVESRAELFAAVNVD